jgi:hypothetical protein
MSEEYVVLERKHDGLQAIKLLADPFSGIIYTYGKIEFEEDADNDILRLKFEYDIVDYADKQLADKKPFEAYIGGLLEQMIHEGIEQNNLTYTGGIDNENRTGDLIEPDSQ